MSSENLTVLHTPFYDDLPRTFVRDDSNMSEKTLFGPYAQTIWNFAYTHQMRLTFDRNVSVGNRAIFERIYNGEYNLSMNGGTIVRRASADIQFSYPLYEVKNCIMVPMGAELPKYWYIVWPFGRYIYTCILFGIFYVAILMKYIEYRTNETKPTRSFTRNILHSGAIIMFSSNMNVQLKNAHGRVLFFYTLLFVLGFILAAYHAPYLTAYNMKPLFMPPVNTVEDLLAANIKVLITLNDYMEIKHNSVENMLGLSPLLQEIPKQKFENIFDNLNRNYAYVITEYQWKFLNRQQRVLIQPYFHLSNICFGTVFKAIPVRRGAAWFDALNLFILIVHETGFWNQWEERAFNEALRAKDAQILKDTYPLRPLNLAFFTIAWIVLAAGLTLSCCAFIFEYYLKDGNRFRYV